MYDYSLKKMSVLLYSLYDSSLKVWHTSHAIFIKKQGQGIFSFALFKIYLFIISNYDFSTLYLKNKRAKAKITSRLYFCIDNNRMLL